MVKESGQTYILNKETNLNRNFLPRCQTPFCYRDAVKRVAVVNKCSRKQMQSLQISKVIETKALSYHEIK